MSRCMDKFLDILDMVLRIAQIGALSVLIVLLSRILKEGKK